MLESVFKGDGMCIRRYRCVVRLLFALGVAVPSIAQDPTGPLTLDNLLGPETSAANSASQGRFGPMGSPTRPKHADDSSVLSKAWNAYETTVEQAANQVQEAIASQIRAFSDKGDLRAREKWEAIKDAFESHGKLPVEPETRPTVRRAVAKLEKATGDLAKAYTDVIRSLTKEDKVTESKAFQAELDGIRSVVDGVRETFNRELKIAADQAFSQPATDQEWRAAKGAPGTVSSKTNRFNPLRTGLKVKKGAKVFVAAHPDDSWHGGGTKAGRRTTFRGYGDGSWMQLRMKIGETISAVGDETVVADEDCELLLFCNDDKPGDNVGSIRVKVLVIKD